MIVVLDTNIWKSQIYLQSTQATATRFFLRQKMARLGLPEVIKREVESHFKHDVLALISSMKESHSRLLKMFGKLKELVLPDERAVDKIVSKLFNNVGVEILPVPFSFESANASFQRLIDKVAPSETKEQFKDGVIWADCLELLQSDDVFLITDDKAFYKDRDHSQGIAPALAADLLGASHSLTLLARLTDLLSEVKESVVLDNIALAHSLMTDQKDSIVGIVANNGFEIGDGAVVQRKLFATENSRLLFVEFTIEYNCPDLIAARESAVLKVDGECRYNVESKTFDQFVVRHEELKFKRPDGTQAQHNVIMAVANMFMGHKDIENIVRVELE